MRFHSARSWFRRYILQAAGSSHRSHGTQHTPRLGLELLEKRQVLAAYINELHISPLFGNNSEDQYIELRGEPNERLPAGTYFIGIESADGVNELGDIHTVIDLSNQQMGANGLLAIIQSASGFNVNPAATVLQGTNGFQGLQGGIFSADGNATSIHAGSSTYLLIQSSTPISLATDIDLNDDGIPDNVYPSWQILDGVAMLPWVESVFNQHTYAPIVFSEDGVGATMAGATFVATDQLAYVGRIGNSTGYLPGDWLAGNTVETSNGTAGPPSWQFQLQHGVFGTVLPYAYSGRILNHIGSPNWYGSVSGTVIQDTNQDGVQQPGEVGLAGINVGIDWGQAQNGNFISESIEPNSFATGSTLTNVSSNVTLTVAGSDNAHQSFKVKGLQRSGAPAGEHIFSSEGIGWFSNTGRLRMDFYQPAHSVSITAIGNSNLSPTYGRLEIFNSSDQSLGFVRTASLGEGVKQRLTLTSAANDIAWAVAYSDNGYLSSSPFGMFDELQIEISDTFSSTTSGPDGKYTLPRLPLGSYSLGLNLPVGAEQVFPSAGGSHQVVIAENFPALQDRNFGIRGTAPPTLNNVALTVSESTSAGVFSVLPVTLGYPTQQLEISIAAGDPDGLFAVNSSTFELMLNRAELDFETQPTHTLQVLLKDTANPSLTDTATITLTITDANDAPIVQPRSVSLPEHSPNGTPAATAAATDQDPGLAGEFTWSISGGNPENAFSIDATTGVVTVSRQTAIDFETRPTWQLVLRATDKGSPSRFGEGVLTVQLSDRNDVPTIPPQTYDIVENSLIGTQVAQALAIEPDQGQTVSWAITGGSGQSVFAISATGLISVAANLLDFEALANYSLEVEATDSSVPPATAIATIAIRVVNANDPPVIGDVEFQVSEDAVGSVGIVVATDQDVGQTHSFEISGGPDASLFSIDPASGELSLNQNAELDFESAPELFVEVTVRDSFAPPAATARLVRVQVLDVNEPPILSAGSFTVVENSPAGTKIADVVATDQDAGDAIEFSIGSQTQPWVTINPQSGALFVAAGANINFEQLNSITLVVRATDKQGLASEATMSITATNANDAPQVANAIAPVSVKVGEPLSMTISANTFTDEDGDTLNYRVVTSSGFALPGWLSFDATTRELSGTPTVAQVGVLDLLAVAIDPRGAGASSPFTVTVEQIDFSWQNPASPFDANNDSIITAVDALQVINYLNANLPTGVPTGQAPTFGYIDINGDDLITPNDVLQVINYLNANANGEGESQPNPDDVSFATPNLAEWNFHAGAEQRQRISAVVDELLLQLLAADHPF